MSDKPRKDELGQVIAWLNDRGQEMVSRYPVEAPIPSKLSRSTQEMVRELVRGELSRQAEMAEMESFEEADDFDIEDDPLDQMTPYEAVFDPKFAGPLDEPAEPVQGASPAPPPPPVPPVPPPVAPSPPQEEPKKS